MGQVTALRAARAGALELEVEGRVVCTMSSSLAAELQLQVGAELDGAALNEVCRRAALEAATAQALGLLKRRARSRSELVGRLRAQGHNDSVVEEVVTRLSTSGLVDDADFARRYAADKHTLNGWGVVRIRRGLSALGVEEELIVAALAERGLDDLDREVERAVTILLRKGAEEASSDAAQRRAYQLLLRRGFSSEVALAAVRRWRGHTADGAQPN